MKFLFDRFLGIESPAPDRGPESARREYRLDSAVQGAYFSASIQAWWLPVGPDRASRVFQYLWAQARAVTTRFSVLDATAANDALNEFYAIRRVIPDSDIQTVTARAVLEVAEKDREFAERKADIERRAIIEAADLEAKRAYLMRLRALFLGDAAMARLWWSNGDPDRVLRLGEHPEVFAAIVSSIAESSDSSVQPDKIAPLIGRFLADLGPHHREYLIGQLARIFENYQQQGLAEELRAMGSDAA